MERGMILLYIGGAIAVALILRGFNVAAPGGIRRNNPGNLRPLASGLWDGQNGTSQGFCTFSTPVWGLRAMCKNLVSYAKGHGVNSLGGVATRWAPPFENNAVEYTATLASVSGLGWGSINLLDPPTNLAVMRGIVQAENGQKFPGVPWFSDSELRNAQLLAGLK